MRLVSQSSRLLSNGARQRLLLLQSLPGLRSLRLHRHQSCGEGFLFLSLGAIVYDRVVIEQISWFRSFHAGIGVLPLWQ